MDLARLLDRFEHERGGEHEDAEVMIVTPSGRRYEVLSLNWDGERGHWLLIGEGVIGDGVE